MRSANASIVTTAPFIASLNAHGIGNLDTLELPKFRLEDLNMSTRKVGYAEYKERDALTGTVTVYYRRGGRTEHAGIPHKEFRNWYDAGWNLTYKPS